MKRLLGCALLIVILMSSLKIEASFVLNRPLQCVSISLEDYRKSGSEFNTEVNQKLFESLLVKGQPYLEVTFKEDQGRKLATLTAFGSLEKDTPLFKDTENDLIYESSLAKECGCQKTPCVVGELSVDKNAQDDYDHRFKSIGKHIVFYNNVDLNHVGYYVARLSVRSAPDYRNNQPSRLLLCKI